MILTLEVIYKTKPLWKKKKKREKKKEKEKSFRSLAKYGITSVGLRNCPKISKICILTCLTREFLCEPRYDGVYREI